MFHGVHFNQDSRNTFSVNHNSWTQKMVVHSILKICLPPHPLIEIDTVSMSSSEGYWLLQDTL